MNTGKNFLAAVRGIPTHHVAKALCTFTSGIDWTGSSKQRLAERFDDAFTRSNSSYPALARVDLGKLAKLARARAEGFDYWYDEAAVDRQLAEQANTARIEAIASAAPELIATLRYLLDQSKFYSMQGNHAVEKAEALLARLGEL